VIKGDICKRLFYTTRSDNRSLKHNLLPNITAQAANTVFRAEIDGLRKYSPPRGATNSCGKVSEAVTFCGSIPVVVLELLTFSPIYSMVREKTRRKEKDYER